MFPNIMNLNIILKFLLTFLALFLSIYFFYIGYVLIETQKNSYVKSSKSFKHLDVSNEKFNDKDNYDLIKQDEINENKIENKEKKRLVYKETISIKVKKNDTFGRILDKFSFDQKIYNKIISLLSKEYNLKNLKIGQEIIFKEQEYSNIKEIIIPISFTDEIIIIIDGNNVNLKKNKIKLLQEIESKEFIVKRSIYEDGEKEKLPLPILAEAIKLLSYDVDFQRDIKKNNKFQISYESFFSPERKQISFGKVKYINLIFEKNNLEYFYFKTDDGYLNYFNRSGKNAQKALMKTPIDGAKLSSSFGMRKHPILGYNKMHKGLDFAAPSGTPIYAAGNGTIEYIGKNGAYGNYIRIRHNGSYKTAYAHLKNFKKGLYKGHRVNQGDIIGFVGTTGRSTGPHLHYEVIYQGEQINPKKMNLPSGKILEGQELNRFKIEAEKIYADFLFGLYE